MSTSNWLPEEKKENYLATLGFSGKFVIMEEEKDDASAEIRNMGAGGGRNEKIDGVLKHSFTEKITGVKNSKAEYILRQFNEAVNREQARRLRVIHQNRSSIRHQLKLMQVDKKKNFLAEKKRTDPSFDYSTEEARMAKSEQYLKEPMEGFYLQKCNAIRRRSVSDPTHVTPIVAKARQTLRNAELEKELERQRSEMGFVFYRHNGEENAKTRSKSVDTCSTSRVSSASSSGRHRDKMMRKESPNMLPWSPQKPTVDLIVTELGEEASQKDSCVREGKLDSDSQAGKHSTLQRGYSSPEFGDGTPIEMEGGLRLKAVSPNKTQSMKPHVSFKLEDDEPRKRRTIPIRPQSDNLGIRRGSLPTPGSAQSQQIFTHNSIQQESKTIKKKMEKFFQSLEQIKSRAEPNDVDDFDILSLDSEVQKHRHPMGLKRSKIFCASPVNSSLHENVPPPPTRTNEEETLVGSKGQKSGITSNSDYSSNSKVLAYQTHEKREAKQPISERHNSRRGSHKSVIVDGLESRRGSAASTLSDLSPNSSASSRRGSLLGAPSNTLQRSQIRMPTVRLQKMVDEVTKSKTRYQLNELEAERQATEKTS